MKTLCNSTILSWCLVPKPSIRIKQKDFDVEWYGQLGRSGHWPEWVSQTKLSCQQGNIIEILQQILLNIFSLIILNCHFKIFELCPASSWCLMSMCLKLKLNKIVYNSCEIVTDRSEADKADLILFKDHFFSRPSVARDPNQIWMIYMLGKWKDERESNIF